MLYRASCLIIAVAPHQDSLLLFYYYYSCWSLSTTFLIIAVVLELPTRILSTTYYYSCSYGDPHQEPFNYCSCSYGAPHQEKNYLEQWEHTNFFFCPQKNVRYVITILMVPVPATWTIGHIRLSFWHLTFTIQI